MLPNSFAALIVMVRSLGGTLDVTAKGAIQNFETYTEPNMRLTITGGTETGDDSVIRMSVSYAKFDEYNKPFEQANYFGRDGVANKTARESGNYHVTDSLYVMADDDPNDYFTEISSNSMKLFAAYNNEKVGDETYVAYLERLVEAHTKAE